MLEAALGPSARPAAAAAPPKRDRLEDFALGLQVPSGPVLDPLEALLDANSRAGPLGAAGSMLGRPLCNSMYLEVSQQLCALSCSDFSPCAAVHCLDDWTCLLCVCLLPEAAPAQAGTAEQAPPTAGSPRATRPSMQPKSRFQAMHNAGKGAKENVSEPLATFADHQKHVRTHLQATQLVWRPEAAHICRPHREAQQGTLLAQV